jgi:hypothetical protein
VQVRHGRIDGVVFAEGMGGRRRRRRRRRRMMMRRRG